ncbi:lipopolysaccharide biosynthesis protein [Halopiger xanaduensis]|uniref:Polysaccharide biosynthesis protein n=1 Tax=Halopiger xanaduensis (strain DSM 18323 / JCM 14033 / SH-6) TaxID=797210 RepID=F8DA32_HALXS|nr:polysaccharide biosynthesis C-terminal domain-containing protein [Halopiger xanaduensis]AEH36951.1 polysaccharide biosynthesis protein [Halopiger xanaduensis SH-6]
MKSKVLLGFLSILGSKLGVVLLGLIITPILVRLLGSTLYGDYAFVMSMLGITMILVNAGIFDGTRKFMVEDRDQQNWQDYVFGFYFRVALGLAFLVLLSFVLFAWTGLPRQLFGVEFVLYFYLLGVLVLGRQVFSVARGGLISLGLEKKSEPLPIIKKVLFGIISLSLVYVGYGVVGVLVGQIVATVVVSIIALVILFKRLDLDAVFGRVPSDFPKRRLLSFNKLSVVFILLTTSLYHIDILLLQPLAGSQATGYYRASLVIAEFLWLVPNVCQTVLLHSSSELWSKKQTDEITELISRVTRYNIAFLVLVGLGLTALAKDFVPLYFGAEFEESVLPLLILLPGVIGFAISRPIFAIGQGKGSLRVLIMATGTAALINLFLNLLLIPEYGMTGAAIATSIGYGSMLIFHVLAARQIGFNPLMDLRLNRIAVTGFVTAIVIFSSTALIESAILSLVVVPPVGFVVYMLIGLKIRIVSPDEIREGTNRLPDPISSLVNWTAAIID